MSKLRNFIINGAYVGAMNLVSRASGLLLNVILVRMLTVDSFGLFALFQRIMEKVSMMIRFGGFETSTHVLLASSQEKDIKAAPSLFSVPLAIRIIFCLIFAILFLSFPTYIATNILKQSALIPYMNFFVFACIAAALEVLCDGVLKGLNLFKILSRINITFALILLLIMPLMTYYFSLTGAIFAFTICLVSRSSAVITIALIQSIKSGYTFSLQNFYRVLLMHIKIGFPSWLPVLIIAPAGIYVISLLTAVAGIDDMAYYRVIVTCGVFIQLIPHSLLPSFITESANESNEEESARFFYLNFKLTIITSVLIGILFLGIMPLFISIVFGSAFTLAVKFFLIYIFTMIVVNCTNVFSSFLIAKKYGNAMLFGNTAHGIFLAAVGTYVIPLYGLPGFLAAELAAWFGALIIYIIFFSYKIQSADSIIHLLIRMTPFVALFILITIALNTIQPVFLRFSASIIGSIFLGWLFWKTVLLRDEKKLFIDNLKQLSIYKKLKLT